MAIKDVETKCYILALFIRNDGARFLLGSGAYEFKEGQQHFAANTMQNDVVEVQGNDGYLLAGQVRRPGVQSFDGYVGDSSTSKPVVEGLRRDFFQFFRKGYFYKVVYVFPDGSAIQRKRGFLVDAPVVQELYQIYPEYHVALNFEDINYYFYDENGAGEEIYGKSAIVGLSMATGGLVWDEDGAVTDPLVFGGVVTVKGAETIDNLLNVAVPLASVGLYGDTYQQTYSGKNLIYTTAKVDGGITFEYDRYDGVTSVSGTPTLNYAIAGKNQITLLEGETITLSIDSVKPFGVCLGLFDDNNQRDRTLQIVAGRTSVTTTLTKNVSAYDVYINGLTAGSAFSGSFKLQLETGSTATAFEPYVGGIPSPNPDYPQEVQTVTGEQTVTVTGKNKLNIQNRVITQNGLTYTCTDGAVNVNGTSTNLAAPVVTQLFTLPAGTYTLSAGNLTVAPSGSLIRLIDSSGAQIAGTVANLTSTNASVTFSLTADTEANFAIRFPSGTTLNNYMLYPMLEQGSTATDYERYQSQSYTISLGSIELCKIGDYQDYIYKSGDDWYEHSEITKVVLDSTLSWEKSASITTVNRYRTLAIPARAFNTNTVYCASSHNIGINASNSDAGRLGVSARHADNGGLFFATPIGLADTVADFNVWVDTNQPIVYYTLATPTDTQITDTTLIGQLEALGAAKLYVGENNLMVTASGTNLPAELEVGYYTEIEDGYGFVWEEGRSPSNIIAVDSIDDVFPVLTITGETENPILTNVTTGTIFQYNGTITASQTLVVDMMNQTATLNGTSVIGNVTGDWVYFAPGNNRVSYTAGNANAPDATIEWQEIVG